MESGINGTDLVNILKIIEICTQRGAFRANELLAVGKIYTKLSNTVEQTSKKLKQETIDNEQNTENTEIQ